MVERSPSVDFIGSLVPSQHPDLLAVLADSMVSLEDEGLLGVRAFRARKRVFGTQRTVLVTFDQKLFDTQGETLLRETAKRRWHLGRLQAKLWRWHSGKPATGASRL